MLSKLRRFFKYYVGADTIYNIHSPFVFEFMIDVLDTKKEYYVYNALEHERKLLLSNKSTINITDHGAGSKTNSQLTRTIMDIAKNVVSNKNKCRILFNLVNKFGPRNILELGTSLGIATMYMSKASHKSTIYTIEADPAIYKLALTLFERNQMKNIIATNNTFENALSSILDKIEVVDLAFIDGNHSYEATMYHYTLLKARSSQDTILVFDDIYWSDEMMQAWNKIKADKDVTCTIDIFDLGFVFFKKEIEKQNFKLIDFWKKPNRIGLFG